MAWAPQGHNGLITYYSNGKKGKLKFLYLFYLTLRKREIIINLVLMIILQRSLMKFEPSLLRLQSKTLTSKV